MNTDPLFSTTPSQDGKIGLKQDPPPHTHTHVCQVAAEVEGVQAECSKESAALAWMSAAGRRSSLGGASGGGGGMGSGNPLGSGSTPAGASQAPPAGAGGVGRRKTDAMLAELRELRHQDSAVQTAMRDVETRV